MERIKTKFIVEVSGKLAAAPDCDAKLDLIEELSENLYLRYLEFTHSGLSEEEAYAKAMGELGEVSELLEVLGQPAQNSGEQAKSQTSGFSLGDMEELLRSLKGFACEVAEESKELCREAADSCREAARKFKEKYPGGIDFSKEFHVHVREDSEFEDMEDMEDIADPEELKDLETELEDLEAEFAELDDVNADEDEGDATLTFPLGDLRAVEIRVGSADLHIHPSVDGLDAVTVTADAGTLNGSVRSDGVLVLEHQMKKPGFFAGFSAHGFGLIVGGRVDLILPMRRWNYLRATAASGDITLESGLDGEELSVQTASGDVIVRGFPGVLKAATASGDVTLSGEFGPVTIQTASGDAVLRGSSTGPIHTKSASGDITLALDRLPDQVEMTAASGDCRLRIPDGQGFHLSYRTVSGDLHSNFALEGPKGSKTYLDGGAAVTASTVSGDISLRRV